MKKKNVLVSLLIIIISVGFILAISKGFSENKKEIYYAGKYEGTGEGNIGPVKVLVTTDSYSIKDIKIVEEYEMPEISKYVYTEIPKKVLDNNSTDVDVISGATYTSEGLINAIKDALQKAEIKHN